jgi:hypothetical protein
MKNKGLIIGIVVLVVVVVGANFVWGKLKQKAGEMIASKVIEGATGGKVDLKNLDTKNGQMTITGKDGTTVSIGQNKLPADFPKDVPQYPGAAVAGSVSGTDKTSGSGTFVTFTTSDAATKVADFYKKEIAGQGWAIQNTMNSNDTTIFTAEKDTRSLSVSVTPDTSSGGKTTITITVGSKN